VLAGCSSSSPKGGSTTVPPLNTAASGASTSTGATASAGASPPPGAARGAGRRPPQTEVLRAYFAYERATWRLWFRNEGLDTMDTVATGQLLTEIKHNAAKTNGQLSRPPVRISVSEVSASEDGNGYAIAACLDKTQMTTVDAQGNDNTNPKIQIYKPIIAFMTQGTDGTWRASQEDSGTPNTCSVN